VAMRAALSQRLVRSRPEARIPGLAIAMLPSVGVTARTGHGSRGLPRPGPVYQHDTSSGYRARMLQVYLGHGAAGSAATMAPWVDGLRARGYETHALSLPRRRAEDAIVAFEAQVPDAPGVIVGGHSFGGRVASLSVAGVGRAEGEPRRRYAGLVCLSYPLHRPGAPETAEARTAHWPRITVPALLCSGTSDPFARLDLLEASMPLLVQGRLETWPKLGHGLLPVREAVLDRIAAFLGQIEAGSAGG
jgi:predicted alpha/beta-hydrolase family hydrolase